MTSFQKALKFTLGIEGGYSNDPADSGGKTRYGITEQKARAWGYDGDMRELPIELAERIYKRDYWDIIHLDDVAQLSEPVALEMFDTSVNCGPSVPVKFLQRALNIFNRGGTDYPDLEVDGLIGGHTIWALTRYLNRRGNLGASVLVEALNSQQGAFYMELTERRPKDEAFAYGWFSQRVYRRAS
jgi:lysozyme family protein